MNRKAKLGMLLAITAFISLASFGNAYWIYWGNAGIVDFPIPFDAKAISVEKTNTLSCAGIDISSKPIILQEGSSKFEEFTVENKTNADFQIWKAEPVENSSGISLAPDFIPTTLPAGQSRTVTIKASAMQGIGSETTTALLRISGIFTKSKKKCNLQDISESFQVIVKAKPVAKFSEVPTEQESTTIVNNYNTNNYYIQNNYYILAEAAKRRQENRNFEKTACSNIVSQTKTFFLSENSEKTQYFTVKNNSSKTFFIESINANIDSEFFTAQALPARTASIQAFGSISIPVKVNARENSAGETVFATFKVSGVFEDNSYCSSTAIGANNFQISTAEEEPAAPTGTLNFYYPDKLQVPANGASFTLTLVNTTGIDGYLKISSPDSTTIVYPQVISFDSSTKAQNFTITAKGLDRNAAWIEFDTFMAGRSFNGRIMKITRPLPAVEGQPAGIAVPQANVSTTIVPTSNGNYDINVTVVNDSNSTITGSAGVLLPSGWKVEGNQTLTIEPSQSKSAFFTAIPSELNDKDLRATAVFETGNNGNAVLQPILLKANKPAFAAAFAVLGANSTGLGIIVLIVLIIIAIFMLKKKDNTKILVQRVQLKQGNNSTEQKTTEAKEPVVEDSKPADTQEDSKPEIKE